MEKLIKFFPFLPEAKDTNKLTIAILFYAAIIVIGAPLVSFILGLTVILLPLGFLTSTLGLVYGVMGIVFAIMKFNGHDFTQKPSEE